MLLHTVNGGQSWRFIQVRWPYELVTRTVFAYQPNVCCVVLSQIGGNRPTRIPIAFLQADGEHSTPVWVGETNGWYRSSSHLFFVDPDQGWLFATECVNGKEYGQIFSTSDAGQTWRLLSREPVAPTVALFADSSNGWQLARGSTRQRKRAYRVILDGQPNEEFLIGGYRYSIRATTDGGRTWNDLSNMDRDLFAIARQGRIRNVVGELGLILLSSDAGKSWIRVNSGTRSNLYSISLLPNGRDLAVGDHGTILRTENYGREWSKIARMGDCSFHHIHFTSDTTGLVIEPEGMYLFRLT